MAENYLYYGDNLDILRRYVNGQYLASVQDSTYKNGAIGVIAENNGHPTEALFNDDKVWRL